MWEQIKYWSKRVGIGLFVLLLFVAGFKSFAIVPVGHTGVVMHFSAAQKGGIQPGLHFIVPFQTTVFNYNTQLQKSTFEVKGASIDSQDINAKVTVNWIPDANKVGEMLDSTGTNQSIIHKILNPAVQGSFKQATAMFKANEILPKRSELKELVVADLRGRLERDWIDKTDKRGNPVIDEKTKKVLKKAIGHDIFLNAVSVENLSFSDKYSKAIEAKAEAEQLALKAGYLEQKAKAEARGVVATAEGNAKAQRLQATSISTKFLELRKVEVQEKAIAKWDGVLPKFQMGAGGSNGGMMMNISDAVK